MMDFIQSGLFIHKYADKKQQGLGMWSVKLRRARIQCGTFNHTTPDRELVCVEEGRAFCNGASKRQSTAE